MKKGFLAKQENDAQSLERARDYCTMFTHSELYPIIQYRTVRGETYGVLLNQGEKVIVWNAFTEKLEKYNFNDYENRFISIV